MSDERSGSASDVTQREFVGGQKLFGRYTLVKILGRGGMGIVWLARDEELEREVALKFLPDLMLQDRAALDDLKRETRRSLELTHPHIIRIHDFVHDERSGCISMEYVDGETLASLRCQKEQKVFGPEELASWMAQLCDALDYAHNRARVIHRDLKPANLMVNQRGDLKVADFGIARTLAESLKLLTAEQGRSGTLVYMSPQQLDGERGTHLDDIYSLGATIYDLLTSKPPFYSGNVDRQIHERIAPSMTERRKDLNIEPALVLAVWEETIAACLAKDPAGRPQSAAEVAQRLQLSSGKAGTVPSLIARRPRRKMLLPAGIAAAFLLALAGSYFGFLNRHGKPGATAARSSIAVPVAVAPEKSIAVLPFENLSESKQNAHFADGVHDEILTNLAKVADLKVISRTSVMQYTSDVKRNLREIAAALGVARVVEGTVQREGQRVRINAQLIDAHTDTQMWSKTFDRDLADVFAMQSEVAEAIVGELKARLSPTEKAAIEERPTADVVAYDLYVQAKNLSAATVFSSREKESLALAVNLLEQAIARDPTFFLAYYELALTHDRAYILGVDHTPSRLSLAEKAVETARRLRPNSGEAHQAYAFHLYCAYLDYDQARAELAVARQLLPNESFVFELAGYIDRRQGRWEDSAKNFERGLELDPRNVYILQQLSISYHYLRRYAERKAVLDRALEIVPGDVVTRGHQALVELDWHADTKPLHETISTVLAQQPAAVREMADLWLIVALCERDFASAELALKAMGSGQCIFEDIELPPEWCQGLVARAKGDSNAARAAFQRARAAMEIITRDQPDYAAGLSVLALIDAGLGRKGDAIREGNRAVELLPISKDSINGTSLVENLAIIYAWTGETDLALEKLSLLASIPATLSYGSLCLHPEWDPLRNDPRFANIIASLAPKPQGQTR